MVQDLNNIAQANSPPSEENWLSPLLAGYYLSIGINTYYERVWWLMKKFILLIAIISLTLTGCSRYIPSEYKSAYYETEIREYLDYLPTPSPRPTPSPESAPEPTPFATPIPLPSFTQITGKVIYFDGPMYADGTVPWYVEWFEIGITKDDENYTVARIIGMQETAFLFGHPLSLGMTITAFIRSDTPEIIGNTPEHGPIYLASAIVAEIPPGQNLWAGWSVHSEYSLESICGNYSFEINDYTIINMYGWPHYAEAVYTVLFYDSANAEELPLAARIAKIGDESPVFMWSGRPEIIELQFTDLIFPASYIHAWALDLPIYVNGVEIEAPPPILGRDGETVLVPFRPMMMAGMGFGNYAYLTADGRLEFGGGGGGSENSYWELGSTIVRGIGWSNDVLCTPPIIVGGVIYVPLISFAYAAPFADAWLLEDRISGFNTDRYPYGP